MYWVVGVRFKKATRIYYFDPRDQFIDKGSYVVVETARGLEYGKVVVDKKQVEEKDVVLPLRPVIRLASLEDEVRVSLNKRLAKEAIPICQQQLEEHGLPMKLVDAEYTFDRAKLIFHYLADGRVDFRSVLKVLPAIFRTRIELHQIGVRDEAKLLGGIGPCGRVLCCTSWLSDFDPVSIRMAKGQNLSLNPAKISGLCGRLMCCLKFENDAYQLTNINCD